MPVPRSYGMNSTALLLRKLRVSIVMYRTLRYLRQSHTQARFR